MSFPAVFDLTTLNGNNGFSINGLFANGLFGGSASSVGDVNGDGIDDMIIGAYAAGPNGLNGAGQAYVVFGQTGGFFNPFNLITLNGSNGFTINGLGSNDFLGASISSLGDVNGDGRPDTIIGAQGASPSGLNKAGQAYIIYGQNGRFPALFDLNSLSGNNGFVVNGLSPNDQLGCSVSGGEDINGDGNVDIVIAASTASPDGLDSAGQVYVIFGQRNNFANPFNVSNLNGNNGFIINGLSTGSNLGSPLIFAGDINNDGKADLILVAYVAGGAEAYIIFGQKSFSMPFDLNSLNGKNGFVVKGLAFGNGGGRSVSNAGDINGDNIDDIIIGASNANPNGLASAGQAYVIFGSRTAFPNPFSLNSLNGSNGFVINGLISGDALGVSVNAAGDINVDGKDDIIIGASRALSGKGQAYLIFGQTSFASVFNLNDINGTNGFIVNGLVTGDQLGKGGTCGVGDIDGNKIDDVIIGAIGESPNGLVGLGASYIIFGQNSAPAPEASTSEANFGIFATVCAVWGMAFAATFAGVCYRLISNNNFGFTENGDIQ